jgi:hypothetical protein
MRTGKYDAMTVNERLGEAGFFSIFDRAAFAGKDEELARVLALVELPEEGIKAVIDRIHNSP